MKIEVKKAPIFKDDRGIFFPIKLERGWVQSNISISKKYTFRGLHHQLGKTAQTKLITVITGRILDVVVDLKKGNFGDVQFFKLFPGDQIEVPAGFAHGFLALDDNTQIQYLVDNEYSPKTEISFDWKSVETIKELLLAEVGDEDFMYLSPKDAAGVPLTIEHAESIETLP